MVIDSRFLSISSAAEMVVRMLSFIAASTCELDIEENVSKKTTLGAM